METFFEVSLLNTMTVDEKLRMRLLEEEFKLRKKQPEAWTKTKYRKYANFGLNRKKKESQ